MATGHSPRPPPSDELCGLCSTIDFMSYFNEAKDCQYDNKRFTSASHGAFHLGVLKDICLKSQTCSFCWIVAEAICTSEVIWETTPEELLRKEESSTKPTQCWMYSYCFARNEIFDESDPQFESFRIAIACRTVGIGERSSREDKMGDIQLLEEDTRRLRGSSIFFGRQLNPELSVDLAQYWLEACEEHHEAYCGRLMGDAINQFSDPPRNLLVIDLKRECIVDLPASASYMTLSYCWPLRETPKLLMANQQELRRPQSLRQLQDRLPGTIRDAMNLVRNMGEVYLWVDALCIIQDSQKHKNEQLSQMDKVYGHSRLTIVPAIRTQDAEDACRGLPRYNPDIACRKQKIAVIGGLRLAVAFEAIMGLADDRTRWGSRGWTYQECLLSRRILFLTQTQAYFQCRCSVFCEDTMGEINTMRTSISPFTNLYNAGAPFAYQPFVRTGSFHLHPQVLKWEEGAIGEYLDYVQDYSSRKLTYTSDIFNAFKGLQEVLKFSMGSDFWYGLPEKYWDSALLFNINSHRPRTAELERHHPRNPGFPSWSWVDWNCFIDNGLCFQPQSGIKREVSWYLVNGDKASLAIESKGLKAEGSFPYPGNRELKLGKMESGQIASRVTRAEFKLLLNKHDAAVCHLACWTMVAELEVTSQTISLGIMDTKRPYAKYYTLLNQAGQWVGFVSPRDPSTWIQGSNTRRFGKFMLMSRSRSIFSGGDIELVPEVFDTQRYTRRHWCYLNVMMVQMSGGIGEQCGIGVVHEDAWIQSEAKEMLVKLA